MSSNKKKTQEEKDNGSYSEIFSALAGGAFFAIPYLALGTSLLPSLLIGGAAFAAGELVFHKDKAKEIITGEVSTKKMIELARNQNKEINRYIDNIEDSDMRTSIFSIHDSVDKILNEIEKNPDKIKKLHNFFDYYLPITLQIIERYDNIENQHLSSSDIKKFNDSTSKMLINVSTAFSNMLNNLYQSDIIDIDAEMKVFETMLSSDGFSSNQISKKD